jgi:hypothetical protein
MNENLVAVDPFATVTADLGDIIDLGHSPYGGRRVVPILGGTVSGPRLSGRILPGGADWQIVRPDGVTDIHASYAFETDEGARVTVDSRGLRHGPPEVINRLYRGETVDPSEYFFRTLIRFEAGNEETAWLNKVMALGNGRRAKNAVILDLFEIL